ncbi:MAG: hypothetical protein M5U28_04625 [Sandaracinaceae bacterium]|nr:hypothetical protein [Sandaracinaceae bacterium]
MPRVSHVAERIREAIAYGRERAGDGGPVLAHGAIPLCLMPGLEDAYGDLKTHRFASMIEVGEADFFPVDDLNKLQPEEKCRGCSLSGACPGLYRGYHEVYGSDELAPVRTRPRSNSFNYAFDALVTAQANGGCPILEDGVTPWDRARHLFVRHGARIARFRADTRDFSDAEIGEIKHDLGQLYLDVSQKDAPTTSRRTSGRSRAARCATGAASASGARGCSSRASTTILHARRGAAARHPRGARGRGDRPRRGRGALPRRRRREDRQRRDPLRRDRSGDGPDRATARALALGARGGGDGGVVGQRGRGAERRPRAPPAELEPPRRPGGGRRRDRARAASGGTVTIADDVAFGLVRSRPQARRAERSAARFEHYRNDTADDAARVLAGSALVPLERREAGRGTSTLWLLRYARE